MTITETLLLDPWQALAPNPGLAIPERSFAGRYLIDRGVSPEVAYARGYASADEKASTTLPPEFKGSAVDRHWRGVGEFGTHPSLVIPLYSLAVGPKTPVRHQIRFQTPRLNADGKPIKFDGVPGQDRGESVGRTPVDFHPLAHDAARDVSVPLVITEGVVKGDSILSAARAAGIPVAVASLTGVYMGHVSADDAHPMRLVAGLARLPLTGRQTLIAFDADVEGNLTGVALPLLQLGRLLREAGAHVRVISVPPVNEDSKAGIDDALAAGASLADMLTAARPFDAWEADFAPRIAAVKPEPNTTKTKSPFSITAMIEATNSALEMDGRTIWIAGEVDESNPKGHAFIKRTPTGEILILTDPVLVERNNGKKAVDPLGYLSLFHFGGDYRKARAWAEQYRDDPEALYTRLAQLELDPLIDDDEPAQRPGVVARVVPTALSGAFATSSVEEAVATVKNSAAECSVDFLITADVTAEGLPKRLIARVSNRLTSPNTYGTGLWRMEEKFVMGPDGSKSQFKTEVWHQLTDYVLFQTQSETVWSVRASGEMVEAEPATVSVRVVKANLATRVVEGLTLAEASSAERAVTALNCGLILPETPSNRAAVSNMLRSLAFDHRQETRRYTQTGWIFNPDAGTPEFVLPAGSMGPDGPIDTYKVWGVAGSDPTPDALAPYQAGMGVPELPTDPREAIAAIAAFLAIAPRNQALVVSMIAAAFMGPLRLRRRVTVFIQALTDSLKSTTLSLLGSFWSRVIAGGDDFSVDGGDLSLAGATAAVAWHVDSLCLVDDLKPDLDAEKNKLTRNVFDLIARGAYSGATKVRGTQAGGSRARFLRREVSVLAGEAADGQLSTVNRTVFPTIARSDLDLTAVTRFRREFANTHLSNRALALFLHDLANEFRGMPVSAISDRHSEWQDEEKARLGLTDRSDELVSAIAVTWRRIRFWAASHGSEDLLPSQEELDSAFHQLAGTTRDEITQASPGLAVVEALSRMLAGHTAHLTDYRGETPDAANAQLLGWNRVALPDGVRLQPRGLCLGCVTKDWRYVVLNLAAIGEGARQGKVDGLKTKQVLAALQPFAKPGTTPGEKAYGLVQMSTGDKLRAHAYRCVVLPASALGIEVDSGTPEVAA